MPDAFPFDEMTDDVFPSSTSVAALGTGEDQFISPMNEYVDGGAHDSATLDGLPLLYNGQPLRPGSPGDTVYADQPDYLPGNESVPLKAGNEHYIAPFDENSLGVVDALDESEAPASLWTEAWRQMRRRPLFWIAAALIVLVLALALFPQLFTSTDPLFCQLGDSVAAPRAGHPFGFDRQGCDVFARIVYGARASVTVGVLTTAGVVILGILIGAVAGFYGGIWDSLLSRLTDIFFAIPLLLAAILISSVFSQHRNIWLVAATLAVFGWPSIARITRGAVLAVKNNEFVTAAKALGQSRWQIMFGHIIPNAIAPVIATATVSLGTFIVAEATLSFLGVGLPPSVVSWGGDISRAQALIRQAPHVLFYPAGALGLTVLSFVMMGDVVRDALDPKARTR